MGRLRYDGLGGRGQVQEELAVQLVKPYLSLRADSVSAGTAASSRSDGTVGISLCRLDG